MKNVIFSCCAIAALVSAAGEFPYAQNLTRRYELASSTTVESFTTPVNVPAVSGGMQSNEDIAVFESGAIDFCASDAENWTVGTNNVGTAQAALSMKYENSACRWMGYVGGAVDPWVELTGVAAAEGEWCVRIEIDYTASPAKVRYLVKSSDSSSYTALTSGGIAWLPLGGSATAVGSVKLYGYGEVASLVGNCAARPIEGSVTKSESIALANDRLQVQATVTDSWGAENVQVVLKDANNQTVASKSGTITDGTLTAEFADLTPGATYKYEINLLGKGQTVKEGDTSTVDLFSDVDWFGFRNGSFVKATSSAITIADSRYSSASTGTVTPDIESADGAETTVEMRVVIDGVYQWTDRPSVSGAQFALALVRKEGPSISELGDRSWAYKTAAGDWTPVVSSFTTDNGTYDVKVAFDYRDGHKTATCYIKTSAQSEYTTLVSNVSLGDAAKLNGTKIMSGDVASLNASYRTSDPAPTAPEGTTLNITRSSEVELAKLTAGTPYTVNRDGRHHYSWSDEGGRYAKVDANGMLVVTVGTPANNVPSFTSYLLGLDPADANSKPYLTSQQVSDPNTIAIELPSVQPKSAAETGVALKYDLVSADDPSFSVGKATVTTNRPSFTVQLPAQKVRYYKVDIRRE